MDPKQLPEHGAEGLETVMASPSVTATALLYICFGLIAAGVVWAFFGRADVTISSAGDVRPTLEPTRVYSPVSGELVTVYFLEGETVTAGTVMARLKSQEAIGAATNAKAAQTRFSAVKREFDLVPERKQLLVKQLEVLQRQREYQLASIGDTEEQLKGFDEAQKLKTEIIQDRIRRADESIARAKETFARYQRLFEAGAVAKKELEDQEQAWKVASDEAKSARLQASADYTAVLDERRDRVIALDTKRNAVLELELEIRKLQDQIQYLAEQAQQQFDLARVEMEAAQQVTFEDLDTENLLKIKAPVSGIITDVGFTQPGDKVAAATPLFTISAHDDKCLMIRISDQDRAFVEPGMRVKIKVNAFPYTRFGFLTGYLESITPTPRKAAAGNELYYLGKVVFAKDQQQAPRDYFVVGGEKRDVRFGMTVTAEIVIDRRRLIEFALDSFRNLKP